MIAFDLTNVSYIERLYETYLQDPSKVDEPWHRFLEGMKFGLSLQPEGEKSRDLRIFQLIEAYRLYGHLEAICNPIALHPPEEVRELALETLGFSKAELSELFPTCTLLQEKEAPLQTLLDALKKTYCGSIGVEYMGLGSPEMEKWLQERIEPGFVRHLSEGEKKAVLHDLCRAEVFESFLHTKFVGQKRFSLEGCETLIPLLSALLLSSQKVGVQEAVIGMSHRGRLNVLVNILGKSYEEVFAEFEDSYSPDQLEGTGDVKYHKGFSGEKNALRVSLTPNSSHLESVDPIVEGQARGLQDEGRVVLPLLIHGDAAIAGQGVVYETAQLSRTKGYSTGGTIHIIVNNQIGFTTLPEEGRSTRYASDLAKTFSSPVFHVNAEDVEGCIEVAKLAAEMRETFHCDVFIDLCCYRKYGHNESDDPTFTQPQLYRLISEKKPIYKIYLSQLVQEGVLSEHIATEIAAELKKSLAKALECVKTERLSSPAAHRKMATIVETKVPLTQLQEVARQFCQVPEGFHLNAKIRRLFDERARLEGIDWGMGEYLAYATLLMQGRPIRLSGQDVERGTFSHRHAVWVDQEDASKYLPLAHLSGQKASFAVYNSPLSEFAVLGFEFGYTLSRPDVLVLWEAQFGDFANSAQVIIDQYLAGSETKWGQSSQLTLLLPHGYEGQGSEHSSARIERFLQLASDDNMIIANCTTPAQLFHLLRRQALQQVKKPLVLFTPKALLRHPECYSSPLEFTEGSFQEILATPAEMPIKRLLLCSGKIFYDLLEERKKRNRLDVAIIRLEQLYPISRTQLIEALKPYRTLESLIWVQEEPQNMGAWSYISDLLSSWGLALRYTGRASSASSATGSHRIHEMQKTTLYDEVFNL